MKGSSTFSTSSLSCPMVHPTVVPPPPGLTKRFLSQGCNAEEQLLRKEHVSGVYFPQAGLSLAPPEACPTSASMSVVWENGGGFSNTAGNGGMPEYDPGFGGRVGHFFRTLNHFVETYCVNEKGDLQLCSWDPFSEMTNEFVVNQSNSQWEHADGFSCVEEDSYSLTSENASKALETPTADASCFQNQTGTARTGEAIAIDACFIDMFSCCTNSALSSPSSSEEEKPLQHQSPNTGCVVSEKAKNSGVSCRPRHSESTAQKPKPTGECDASIERPLQKAVRQIKTSVSNLCHSIKATIKNSTKIPTRQRKMKVLAVRPFKPFYQPFNPTLPTVYEVEKEDVC